MDNKPTDMTSIGLPISDETGRITNVVPVLSPGTAMLVSYKQNEDFRFLIDKDQVVIGRSEEIDILLDDTTVSRQHACITKVNENYFIEDLKSLNGTYVNGNEIVKQMLNNADLVQLGRYKLVFFQG